MPLESYDLFDTLITRTTRQPIDVFRLLGAHEGVRFRLRILERMPFVKWRRMAERIARRRSSSEDIELKDIYRLLGLVIHAPSRVMRQEVRLENSLVCPIPDAIDELRKVVESGVPCCIISDMYLPHRVLRGLVRRHAGNIPVYASSQTGLTKASGRLFQHVAQDMKVSPAEIHHRGDNVVSDHSVPLRLGMRATLMPFPDGGVATSALDVFRCHVDDPLYEMGFRLAGPTAFVTALALGDHVARSRPSNVIFAARDMHLVKYAFDRLSPVSSHYCRISRSAVYRAQAHTDRNPEKWFEGVSTGDKFFSRLDLDCPVELRDLVPYQHPTRFLTALEATDFGKQCEAEHQTLKDYLIAEGFRAGTLFVDLGWRGSIQDAINGILAPSPPVEGFYFGTLESSASKQGLYFEASRPYTRFYRVLQSVSFFEFLFTEDVPSLSRVARAPGGFHLVDTTDETEEQVAARTRIADGAKAYIDLMLELHKISRFSSPALLNELDSLYDRYLVSPPEKWVAAMDSMTHSGGFGGSGTSSLIGSDRDSPLEMLKAPWKGGYVVKHRSSRWFPLFNAMHNCAFFVAYDTLKRAVRNRRSVKMRRSPTCPLSS